jgi:hypothetical protein
MLVFDIFVNGQPLCRAGVGASGVLSAITSWVGPVDTRGKVRPENLFLHVGGMVHPDEHVSWLDQLVKRGDKITIEILEADHADEARRRQTPPRPDPTNPPELKLAKRSRRGAS